MAKGTATGERASAIRHRSRPPSGSSQDIADLRLNRILAGLSEKEFARIGREVEVVSLDRNDCAYVPRGRIRYIYFPLKGVISVVTVMKDGTELEGATVGNEGCVGLSVFLGLNKTGTKALCQVPGVFGRMKAEAFERELRRDGELSHILQRYTEALITQLAQTAACNAAHSIEQRCARWLLQTHDRIGGDHFVLTQEFLGGMLAVRRAGVSEVCSKLQAQNLIRYNRGQIEILDRKGLEETSCECYEATRSEFNRLLGNSHRR
jgi:CRP-like cAMP-binding protein